MVLRHYDRYDSSPFLLNEGYTGWQIYMNNRDSIPFDSYIMGNSCTMAYQCREWEKYLRGGRAIRLFGNGESLIAISMKLQALDKNGANIKNLLLILDKESLHRDQLLTEYCNILPPDISGMSHFEFHKRFCQAFFFPNVFFPYLDYKLFHTYRPYMQGIINPYGIIRDPVTNDAINPRERMIKKEGEKYWENRNEEFRKKKENDYRDGKYKEAKPAIQDSQLHLLKRIESICRKHNTSVKIIISPDFHQISISPEDIKILKSVFGSENIFDFTGINEYTGDIHNYYEKEHYRPILGAQIMEKIYKGGA